MFGLRNSKLRLLMSAAATGGGVYAFAKEADPNISPITCEDGTIIQPWASPSRLTQTARLRKETFDVLVIGGGATGAGCALDAASRGLNVGLVERSDFASGTSGRSTKLIHGGIRYLEAAFKRLDYSSYKLVNEALEERAHMLSAAPYMNKPLPIMIPIYKWWEVPYMWVGTKVYDLVAGSQRFVPASYYISADEAMFQYPMLRREGLKGALVYYDGQMNDTRMNLSIALTAAQSGAAIGNHIEVLRLLKDPETNKVIGAHVRDVLTKEEWDIHAKTVVNATGPFSDAIRLMDNPKTEKIVVPAAGVHVVLPDHFSPEKMGLIVPKTSDGRVLFFLPWENATLAGTTDSESEITMFPSPTKTEVQFIIDEANRYLDKNVKIDDVRSAWSGIRPLVKDPKYLDKSGGSDTAKLSREHVIEVSDSGLVTIAGGKWTTYRRMAQDAIDTLVESNPEVKSNTKSNCRTKEIQMVGADRIGEVCGQKFDKITVTLREKYWFDKDVADHLMRNYGTRALQIAEIEKKRCEDKKGRVGGNNKRLHSKYPFLEAEVIFAVKQEYAMRATDVIARRMRLAFIDTEVTLEILNRVIDIMAELLSWSSKQKNEELQEALKFLKTMQK